MANTTYYLSPEPPPSVEELGWRLQSREDWRQTTEACVTMLQEAQVDRDLHATDLALLALNDRVETCMLATQRISEIGPASA